MVKDLPFILTVFAKCKNWIGSNMFIVLWFMSR
jgi:hypothetical protein